MGYTLALHSAGRAKTVTGLRAFAPLWAGLSTFQTDPTNSHSFNANSWSSQELL